jgi:hypothetical protein
MVKVIPERGKSEYAFNIRMSVVVVPEKLWKR